MHMIKYRTIDCNICNAKVVVNVVTLFASSVAEELAQR